MQNRKLIVFSLTIFLAASLIFALMSSNVVARSDKNSGTPGAYLQILISPDQQSLLPGNSAIFTINVSNTSDQINLTNVVVKDLFAPDCNRMIGNLPADFNFPPYTCTLNNVQEPTVNLISVEGTNPIDGEVDIATDTTSIDIVDISVTVDANPTNIQLPGGEIDFSVFISNTGSVAVILNSLTSPQFGNLTDPANLSVTDNTCIPDTNLPLLPPNRGEFCSFKAELLGEAGPIPIEVTVSAKDNEENTISESDITFVNISVPVVHSVHFPLVIDMQDEPNNTCSSSFPLITNQAYYFLPNDIDDWYYFDLLQQGNVLVELTNFISRFGQIVIYEGGFCNSLRVLKNNGNDMETKLVPLGEQPPGRYHILVINDGDPSSLERYQLQVIFQKN